MTETLRTTPLHAIHLRLGGRMVPFAGWDMPVQYSGIIAEARAVRTASGIFDVSHMGRFFVEGQDAQGLLNWVHTADIGAAMPLGRARYGLFCNESGGIIDDGIVYRLTATRYLVIANAANAERVLAWLQRWRHERFSSSTIENVTSQIAMIALQGPSALRIASDACGFDASATKPFNITEVDWRGGTMMVARTGYTGEDGVEAMPPSASAPALWEAFMERGALACGLGARDTLRLEAALLLHGSDMDDTINPIEAGLRRFVHLDKDLCGGEAIKRAAENGTDRNLVGFSTLERGAVPRSHAPLLANKAIIGSVTSGGYSPTLDKNIGLGYLPARFASAGTPVQVDVRGKLIDAEVSPLPFYTRPKASK